MDLKKRIVIISIIIFCVISLGNIYNIVYGFSVEDLTGKQINNSQLDNIINTLVTVISTIGSLISVIVIVILGIKYMTGSVEEKAEFKKSFMPYFIGAIIVFAASTIVGIIYNLIVNEF